MASCRFGVAMRAITLGFALASLPLSAVACSPGNGDTRSFGSATRPLQGNDSNGQWTVYGSLTYDSSTTNWTGTVTVSGGWAANCTVKVYVVGSDGTKVQIGSATGNNNAISCSVSNANMSALSTPVSGMVEICCPDAPCYTLVQQELKKN